MYAKVYSYKFSGLSEAKVAAGFCSENLGAKITEYNFFGLNILISQNGDLNLVIKFDDTNTLKKFEVDSEKILNDLRKSFVFKENKFAGVYAYSFEKEAIATEIKISGPAELVKNS